MSSQTSSQSVRAEGLRSDIRSTRVRWARKNPAVFVEQVLRDESSGAPIRNAPMHLAWQAWMDAHQRLILCASIDSGKTQQVVGRVLWELGRDPTLRVLIVSKTKPNAIKIVSVLKAYIQHSSDLQAVFPELRPGPGAKWASDRFTIERPTEAKDYTVEAVGVLGNILGGRFDLIVLDDVIDEENTRTLHRCEEVTGWIRKTVQSRITNREDRPGRVWMLCNAWSQFDAARTLAKSPAWTYQAAPLLDPLTGELGWPERWPRAKIDRWRRQNGQEVYEQFILCRTPTQAGSRFRQQYIDACLARGEGRTTVRSLDAIPDGCTTWCGVDYASGKRIRNKRGTDRRDYSAVFVALKHPNNDLEVLWVESGRWEAPEIKRKLIDLWDRYGCKFVCEDNGVQDWIRQILSEEAPHISIVPFTTGSQKWSIEHGVGSIAADMSRGAWIIPSRLVDGGYQMEPAVEGWVNEMLAFTPDGHTGDRLMASWFVRCEAKKRPFQHWVGCLGEDLDDMGPGKDRAHAQANAADVDRLQGEALWDDLASLVPGIGFDYEL